MTQDELNEKYVFAQVQRGEIISYFANIEYNIQSFVLHSYLSNRDNTDIRTDIFQNQYFSFSLLKNIFIKVLKKSEYLEFYKRFKTEELDSDLAVLLDIRNMAAHGSSGMNNVIKEGLIITDHSEFIIQRGEYGETNASLHTRFFQRYNKVINFIETLPGISKANLRLPPA